MDQVPPPTVIGLDENWDKKASNGHMHVSYQDDGYDKHFFPIEICFHQRGIKSSIALIIQEKGKSITDFEKQSYKEDVKCNVRRDFCGGKGAAIGTRQTW